ncbi:uncharacterized protein At5g43822 isoform X7 [Capsicum annuum]|uniref:uncharacterized protein At5g43822 isoform X7 n=1 Tax=Capsicum annuum TaxID=4072 RepID=UPI001FB05C6E|nr:uncharacterized protein At5g43822 isoform X7 [Capsicum annuum]
MTRSIMHAEDVRDQGSRRRVEHSLGFEMEVVVKKYQQRFRKVKEERENWNELQSRLISQFTNASSIIQRLQILQDSKNYGALQCVEGIQEAVLLKQMNSLQTILFSMNETMYRLKLSVISALSAVALKHSGSDDLGALQQLLVDQPNIPKEEVQFIFDIIFAEEMA